MKTNKGLIISILSAALLITGGLVYLGYNMSRSSGKGLDEAIQKGIQAYVDKQRAAQNAPEGSGEPVDVSLDNDAVMGDEDAPVTIVEFSDFQCPFCSRLFTDALPKIIEKYVKTGKVKFIYRDFPLSFHPFAKPAAIAAECARAQGGDEMYFKFHDQIFGNQPSLSVENLKKWAGALKLDTKKFNECVDSEKFADEVNKDFQDGQKYGVNGTPATFINGRMVSGAQPFEVFEKIIEEELNK